ncbi:MAG: hypothetical protein JKY54_13885 [Flavobacteriales bacterium]|nr:hypothetical protein [Flavobacteriales bacterium]
MERKLRYLILGIIAVITIAKALIIGNIRVTEAHQIATYLVQDGEFKYWINNGLTSIINSQFTPFFLPSFI